MNEPEPNEVQKSIEYHGKISRRSSWSGLFRAIGILGLFVSAIGVFACINDSQSSDFSFGSKITYTIISLAVSLQSFFFAFIINVFTDIRWYLSQIVEKQKETK